MNKKQLITEIGDLLDICQACEKNPRNSNEEILLQTCGGCRTLSEIRSLGAILDSEHRNRQKQRYTGTDARVVIRKEGQEHRFAKLKDAIEFLGVYKTFFSHHLTASGPIFEYKGWEIEIIDQLHL